jgi:hypothetical protein
MPTFEEWFPNAVTGTLCLAFGVVKLIGVRKGIVGGAGQPLGRRLCGT